MKIKVALAVAAMLVCADGLAQQAARPASLDELLKQVEQGRAREATENKQRERRFIADRASQAQLIEQAKQMRANEEARSEQLETTFDENELRIAELQETLTQRLGSLRELFGVLQQAAGDARGQFENSLTNIQFPGRDVFLTELAQKMASTTKLASIEEIERLWFELQREMTESGKVVRFPATLVNAEGNEVQQNVVRVGVFNIVSDGKYLQFFPQTQRVVELGRQPQARFLKSAEALSEANQGQVQFGLDPSRGQLLGLLVQEPNLRERIDQGGVVGYIIIGLGVLAVVVAVLRLVWLSLVGLQVAVQRRRHDSPSRRNPLGRVLHVYHDNPQADVETLELKLGEAVLRETPGLQRFNMLLKVIAVVAPLLGLLGTVVGMIITFQAITLFGTGDPKLMAGGISTALMTTVLGLCVAIPTVLLHAMVAGRSKRLIQVLEEQAAGMIAERAEKQHGGKPAAAG